MNSARSISRIRLRRRRARFLHLAMKPSKKQEKKKNELRKKADLVRFALFIFAVRICQFARKAGTYITALRYSAPLRYFIYEPAEKESLFYLSRRRVKERREKPSAGRKSFPHEAFSISPLCHLAPGARPKRCGFSYPNRFRCITHPGQDGLLLLCAHFFSARIDPAVRRRPVNYRGKIPFAPQPRQSDKMRRARH